MSSVQVLVAGITDQRQRVTFKNASFRTMLQYSVEIACFHDNNKAKQYFYK